MTRSRKNKSRSQARHRKQLRDQQRRVLAREHQRSAYPGEFDFGLFLKKHVIEILCVVILAAGIWGVSLLGPDKKAMDHAVSLIDSEIENEIENLAQKYSKGYKIIALTDTEIIHTSFDTLPEEFHINWKKLSISRMAANALANRDEKIKIIISGIDYAPADISGLELTTSFTRKKGGVSNLATFGALEFVAEIIEDNGERLFLLLGLREG